MSLFRKKKTIEEVDEVIEDKPLKKKWAEKSASEKIISILIGLKKFIGFLIRFIAKSLLVLFILLFVGGCCLAGYLGMKVWPYIEEYKALAYEKFETIEANTFTYLADTVIYDKDGNVISEINVGNYEYVQIEDVSKWVSEGYIAVEDKRFKVHNGIDYKGLARAGVALIKNRGEITQGGSTITQQVLKNGLLTQERTFQRKLIEFFLAPEFEKEYSKQEIMEFYINTNFYGNNCNGIGTASLYYFGKPAKELEVHEAAMLVGMSNNASVYNPKTNYDLVKEKQIFVLGEMLEEGCITQSEYDKAVEAPLDLIYDRESRVKESYQTSYAIHCAILNLMEQDGFEFKYTFKDKEDYDAYRADYVEVYSALGEKIRGGGYTIYTSLNTDMQNELQTLIDESLKKYKEVAEDGRYTFQGASVIVNNETGFVEAIVGGRGTDDEFNRGFLAKRQPGSSIKPIVVYAPAFDSGLYYPSYIMTDKDDPDDKYYPQNYGGGHRGNISIREALGRSINTVAYQIMKDIGPNKGLDYLGKMRFDTITYVDNNNTAISLGGFTYGVRVVDMAKAYSTLVNQGQYIDNNCILKIEYQNEGTIFEENSKSYEVYHPDAAYMTVDCARGVLEEYYGTGAHRKIGNHIAMAKTGTTNDTKDAWFCGASEYYSMAVWVGYDTPKSTGLTGGTLPGQIWDDMMTKLHKDLEVKEFEIPETISERDIDFNGNESIYPTGKTDLFSQYLLNRADEEELAIEERKKIDADNALIGDIQDQLDNLRKYIIKDTDALSYLTNRFNNIAKAIAGVIQTDKKAILEEDLESIKKYFAVDIRNMEKLQEREFIILDKEKSIAKEKEVVSELNAFNSYFVQRVSDIEVIENKYKSISYKIYDLDDESKMNYYFSKLNEIKGYKDILLRPLREELERELEKQRNDLLNTIELSLSNLRGIQSYYYGVESLFDGFDNLLSQAEGLNIDITRYRSEKNMIYQSVMATKPYIPPVVKPVEPPVEETEDIQIDESSSEPEVEEPVVDTDYYTENQVIENNENIPEENTDIENE